MLAEGAQRGALALEADQEPRVLAHDLADLAESRGILGLAPGEHVGEVAEQPGPAEAAAAHHHAVAARLAHHAQRVVRFEHVAVAEHRDRAHRVLERRDRVPVGGAVVELRGGARMQRDRRTAFVLADATRVEEGDEARVDADAELERHRDAAGVRDRGAHDVAEQARPGGDRRAAAAPRDLAHRAAEVEVDVVDVALADQPRHGLAHELGVDAVELEAPRLLVRREAREAQRLLVTFDQRARRDHLAHVETGAEAAAQAPERRVRDARHRCEHDGGIDGERADRERRELACRARARLRDSARSCSARAWQRSG